jgi:hypothetical protein
MGRNHDRRPRHRLVRAKGARLRLADTAARESDATRTITDERLVLGRRWPQDHAPLERWSRVVRSEKEHARAKRWSKDHREAYDRAPQDDRASQDDGEAHEHRSRWPKDDHAPQELVHVGAPLNHQAQHSSRFDPQEEARLAASPRRSRGHAARRALFIAGRYPRAPLRSPR